MLLDVTRVQAKPDFSMIIEFENGEQKHFDMKPFIDEKPWARLKEGSTFLKAYVQDGTVAWPGNLDIDPEILYERSVAQ
jgi:hypothetical protein